MKGLLVKDVKLLLLQKNFFLLILAVVIGMLVFTDDLAFSLGFLSFVVSLFTLSTISYDDLDNGNAFLFTLPVVRSQYVAEKYFLGLLFGGAAWMLAAVLGAAAAVWKGAPLAADLLPALLAILPLMIAVQAITIPFQLKFGGDKGRIAMIGALGALSVAAIAVTKGMKAAFGIDLINLLDAMPMISLGRLAVAAVIAALLFLLFSMKISVSIMNQKEL